MMFFKKFFKNVKSKTKQINFFMSGLFFETQKYEAEIGL